jgi:hypothetical protein
MGFSRAEVEGFFAALGKPMPGADSKDADSGGKYHVSRKEMRTLDGITFDSKKEMNWYRHLMQYREANVVKYFLRQVPFHLPGGVVYRCDFMVVYCDGKVEYQDVKGMRTAMYILKKKQVEAIYPIKIREI